MPPIAGVGKLRVIAFGILALGTALTGAVLLLPPPAWRLSENPLGLFVSVDVEVRGDITRAGMRQRAQEWAMTLHDPAMKMGTEVTALRFRRKETGAAGAVLCLHEDGTPSRWLPANGDCLQEVTTLASRLAMHAASLPLDVPREVRDHLAARAACKEIGWKSAHSISPMTYAADEACMDLQRRGDFLAQRYPQLR
jgi:hypothetical protein